MNCYRCKTWPCECPDGICLIHGDCREVLPQLEAESVDLVLTDPPYGICYSPGGGGKGWLPNGKTVIGRNVVRGDNEPFDPTHLLQFSQLILWGGNHYASRLPDSPTWYIWYKRPGMRPIDFADCEIAWSNIGGPARVFVHLWSGLLRASEKGQHFHPSHKPTALMNWCIGQARGKGIILDPYCGAGPVLRAAKDLGRKAIGIEIEEKYVKIAAERLRQGVLL